jgi:hypothetical protein
VSLLDDVTAKGGEIRARLRRLLPRHAAGETKTDWLIGSMDIALEHHEAVERLVKNKLNGSAFGVVRMVFDAMMRALWINACATPEHIEQAAQDTLFWPKMRKMREAINQTYFGAPCSPEAAVRRAALFEFLEQSWPMMCDYTHSGSRQIAWRFTENELKPDYSDGAVVQAVNLTTVAVLLMIGMLFLSMGYKSKADESASMLRDYAQGFGEQLQATNRGRQ